MKFPIQQKDAPHLMPSTINVVSHAEVDIELSDNMQNQGIAYTDRRAVDVCPDPSKKLFIDASYTEAKTLASQAVSYINSHGASDPLYQSYFDDTPTSRVTSILNAVATEDSPSRTCFPGVIAYTELPSTNIFLCDLFFGEVTAPNLCNGTAVTARNIRGATVLHELTHAVGHTEDVTYGCAADQALPPVEKPTNADSYNPSFTPTPRAEVPKVVLVA
ncbi:hypothetical protein H0H93_000356 [Arthromyces matolae]|nr:hypothetical protein H0H93_000356 [Arthromyces matolae]